jgi:hypothetical protein
MTSNRSTRPAALTIGALGLAAGAALLPAAPASATVLDTDRPKISAGTHDFGRDLTQGAPQKGGHLRWDLTAGVTTPELTGFHYVAKGQCGRVQVKYYDSSHSLLGKRRTVVHCAPSQAIAQWQVDLDGFSSTTVTHVHIDVQKQKATGGFKTVGTALETFD